jgi:hypothetical protein
VRKLASTLLVVIGALASRTARAQPVVVTVVREDSAIPGGVTAALASSLAPSGIEVHDEPTPTSVTRLLLRVEGDGVRIVVEDAITRKTTERTVSLAGVPDDARALTIASAADGLLRATWLEAATPDAPPSPAVVVRIAERTLRPPSERLRLGLRASFEQATEGSSLLGADGVLRVPLLTRALVSVHGGARTILDVSTPNGQIGGHAFIGGVSLGWQLARPGASFGVSIGPSASVASIRFAGDARAPARSSGGSGVAFVTGVNAIAYFRVASRWRLELEPSASWVVHGVEATDLRVVQTGVEGALFGLAFGVAAEP